MTISRSNPLSPHSQRSRSSLPKLPHQKTFLIPLCMPPLIIYTTIHSFTFHFTPLNQIYGIITIFNDVFYLLASF
ncbi:hypothetical protein QVD17_16064 [Tagetes erecta]|uniref:Uncharacterized protein n=1 Tax=Tagetes erecta TaxID=13708 RepID=A0AAD8P0A4_TARER|nr:hypothetical protein QVD17_16064 [Tagetes erecta]